MRDVEKRDGITGREVRLSEIGLVDLFAPTRLYGAPDDFRRFVDEAHRLKLGVLLDVVYNHFGPTGNYLAQFSTEYTAKRHHTDWGEAINFDAELSAHHPAREA